MNAKSEIISLKPSQLARAILSLKGKPVSFEDYKPFEVIYDIAPDEMTLIAGRQIGKSVSMAGSIIAKSTLVPHFNTLYTSPLSQQTSRFSTGYLDPFMNSPILRKYFMDTASIRNVFTKSFNNGSIVTLGYAATEQDADRIRGVFADQLLCDEIQDCSIEALPILAETLSASDYAHRRYTGTAKTENNTLTIMFKRSNMMEWVTKCQHCNYYNIPSDFDTCLKMISARPDGPGCVKCGQLLDVRTGQWLAGRPAERRHLGFHLPQLIFSARTKPKKWNEIRTKTLTGAYSAQKVANEVFGVASGVGGRILSLREAMACCNSSRTEFDKGFPMDRERGIVTTVLGVDWSVSGSTKSYTVITILGYDYKGRCYLLHTERLDGVDILDQVRRVIELYRQFQCSMMGSDRGVGVLQGQLMQSTFGSDKVHMINYVSSNTALRWDKSDNFFAADRTRSIDTMILKFKMGPNYFETPTWNLMEPFWTDALNVFEEESATGRRLYRKDQDVCDDWLHSVVFANLAYMILKGEFTYVDSTATDTEDGLKAVGY